MVFQRKVVNPVQVKPKETPSNSDVPKIATPNPTKPETSDATKPVVKGTENIQFKDEPSDRLSKVESQVSEIQRYLQSIDPYVRGLIASNEEVVNRLNVLTTDLININDNQSKLVSALNNDLTRIVGALEKLENQVSSMQSQLGDVLEDTPPAVNGVDDLFEDDPSDNVTE